MRIPSPLLACTALVLASITPQPGAVCRARTVTTACVRSQPPTGTWKINANGSEGELIINCITDGKVEGTLFGNEMLGSYDEKTRSLSVRRLNKGGFAFQSFKGYLFLNPEVKQVRYHLAGTFQVHSGEGGVPGEYGWYAQLSKLK
jgi:hypothetical protein